MPVLVDVNTCFGTLPTRRVDWSPQRLCTLLDQTGFDLAMTYSLRGVLYDFISGNDETFAVCEANPRLVPVATIDPRRHFGCLEEVERCDEMGFGVFRFFPDQQGWTVDSRPFLNICEAVAECGAAVMLPAGPSGHQTLIGEKIAPYGFNIIIVGAGYGVHAETYAVTAAYDNVYAETHAFNTPGCIEGLVWVAGPDKPIFGSNSPDRYFGAALEMVRCAELSDEDRTGILGGNAVEVLGLEGRA